MLAWQLSKESRPLAGSCKQEALLRMQQVKAVTVSERVRLLPHKHNNDVRPRQSVHSATMYILYLFQGYGKTYVVFVVLYREERSRSWICTWSLVHLRHSLFCFDCFGFIVLFSLYENTLNLKWKLLQGIAFPSFIPLFRLLVFLELLFLMGGRLRKRRIVNGDIIYTCTWWFSYIFIAYQEVLHLTRGYKVSQSSAWS